MSISGLDLCDQLVIDITPGHASRNEGLRFDILEYSGTFEFEGGWIAVEARSRLLVVLGVSLYDLDRDALLC